MPNDSTRLPGFSKLMKTVKILRTHYSNIAGEAEKQLIIARMKGKTDEAAQIRTVLDQMQKDHRKSLDMIGAKITDVDQLRQTQKALRAAADEAHDFVKKLRKSTLTLNRLTKAANFLTDLTKRLTKILA